VLSAIHATVVGAAHFADSKGPDTGFNPFGIIAIGVGLVVLIILLITFRRR
jgi:LPXTG-motif cell wall-anchored protein